MNYKGTGANLCLLPSFIYAYKLFNTDLIHIMFALSM